MVRTAAELVGIAAENAFPSEEIAAEGAAVYIAFLQSAPNKAAAETLTGHQGQVDEFKIRGREIYWLCRKRFSDSEFSGAKLEKILGMRMTVRNSTTVRKLTAKLSIAAEV